jgi:polysaccharide export outer membrane protein
MRPTLVLGWVLSQGVLFAQTPLPVQPSPQQAPAQQQAPIQAPSVSPGMTQPNYVLGPGDTVKVTVWTGGEYLQDNLTIASDGTLLIPFFVNKLVKVSGLTAAQLRDLIQSELQLVYLKPVVQVLTIGFESQKAFIVSDLVTGQFPIYGNTRILDFIAQRGVFGERANFAEVLITRATGERLKVNLYDVVLKGDQSQNIVLRSGDIIYVPSLETVSKKYFMLGEVRTPGILQSKDELTLVEAIAKAGTLSNAGKPEHVYVARLKSDGKPEVLEVNFSDVYKKGKFSQNVPLRTGDIVYVPKNRRTSIREVVEVISPILSTVTTGVFLFTTTRRP